MPSTNVDILTINDDDTAFTGLSEALSLARPVTPDRVQSGFSDESTVVTKGTQPGRIIPRISKNKPNKLQIDEHLPFDNEKPFDELTQDPQIGVLNTDDRSVGDESASSAEVLQDLDRLSRFMLERKKKSSIASSRVKRF